MPTPGLRPAEDPQQTVGLEQQVTGNGRAWAVLPGTDKVNRVKNFGGDCPGERDQGVFLAKHGSVRVAWSNERERGSTGTSAELRQEQGWD